MIPVRIRIYDHKKEFFRIVCSDKNDFVAFFDADIREKKDLFRMAERIHDAFRDEFGVCTREKLLERGKRLQRKAACQSVFFKDHRFIVFEFECVYLFRNTFQFLFDRHYFYNFV